MAVMTKEEPGQGEREGCVTLLLTCYVYSHHIYKQKKSLDPKTACSTQQHSSSLRYMQTKFPHFSLAEAAQMMHPKIDANDKVAQDRDKGNSLFVV